MTILRRQCVGLEALEEATKLLQRARRANDIAGVWEAADIQWNWRKPRDSDREPQQFWFDDRGPVAAFWATQVSGDSWQMDPIVVPDTMSMEEIWQEALAVSARNPERDWDIPVDDDDTAFAGFLMSHGFAAGDKDSTAWMDASDCPDLPSMPDGFRITDRVSRDHQPHPMLDRNDENLVRRLQQCSLYDPALDLAIQTDDGSIAGYSMYWYDPETRIGLVEPVRVHDAYQRRGLARAMVSIGLNRLVEAGAKRLKVSYESEAAGALYLGLGFVKQSTTTWYAAPRN